MAELLTLVDIGDVYFNDWALQRTDAVMQCNAGVRVGTSIEHDAVAVAEAHLLHLVDELALDVALVVGYLNVWVAGLQTGQETVERLLPVDARFTASQHVQVGAVDNQYLHTRIRLVRETACKVKTISRTDQIMRYLKCNYAGNFSLVTSVAA